MRELAKNQSGESRTIELAARRIEAEAAAVRSVARQLDESFDAAVSMLFGARGKILVAGLGTSGHTAGRLAHLLSVGGTPALFISAADGLHGGVGAVTRDDVIVAISKGGESDELNTFVRLCKERGASVMCITERQDNTLARTSDVVLTVAVAAEADPGGRIAMGSSLAASVIGDALVTALMDRAGYSWASFEQTHPGGAVGKQIRDQSLDGNVVE